ncbi:MULTISPECIES: helix-turn-helix domain-containing protein [Paeniglutamicibacter]|uniref:Transcriptional regulator with XRE-family HTH domain n=1 Tax=Paeniglutamicibacter sulfureus TaxID=43666 RepID=A0ABU2BNS9_9MICC|nr:MULTISPECIES: helix-turn-helix transcriptional regulator [Paeniglutamicibacter]MCV9994053.1 helix-turn-helix domain-containing protein [Paeniglutamicibacter sp. ZC-3]MDO2935920.1 helix-turn-helix transcriptional regulator [Paeniglutamicibacter sulfureus]MDR7360309.1 transcriptional regulator with XRE-family HTH domain [Paeniglutamicibacter sulfureus]
MGKEDSIPVNQIRLRVRDAISSNTEGLNQSGIARQAAMSQDALSRSLSGQRNFSASELAALAKILKVSLQWLITGDPRADAHNSEGPPYVRGRLDRVAETVAFPAGAYREVALTTPSVPVPPTGLTPEEAATHVASLLSRGSSQPFMQDLPAAIENAYGIGVFVVAEGPAFDARAMVAGEVTYVVVRGTGAWYQANLVLARELGELVGGRQPEIGHRARRRDQWSKEFAYALLLPEETVQSIDWNKQSPRELAAFLWERGVSAKALAQRLDALGIQRGPALVHADEGTLQLLVWHNPDCLSHDRARAYRSPRIPFDLFSAHLKGMREGRVDGTSLAWMLDTPLTEL